MPKLYSYCITHDTGAAPNPFEGICTLVICKPVIRRMATIDDWIVATGSKKYDLEGQVVYAMKVTGKMTMEEYDSYCKDHLPEKIPDDSGTFKKYIGDCIYDFSHYPAKIRGNIHNEGNRITDLGGKYALLSTHFYYFGKEAIPLHNTLQGIIHQGQGHKSRANDKFRDAFIEWIEKHDYALNTGHASPFSQLDIEKKGNCKGYCSEEDRENNTADEELSNLSE